MKKITIIEDDRSILEMYKIKFEFAKFQVSTAINGKAGLEVLAKEKPDIILLDLMMPEMNGDVVLSELRKKPWGENIPVIIMTNVSYDEAPLTLKELDVSDYIIKASSTPQMVLDKVQALLK